MTEKFSKVLIHLNPHITPQEVLFLWGLYKAGKDLVEILSFEDIERLYTPNEIEALAKEIEE